MKISSSSGISSESDEESRLILSFLAFDKGLTASFSCKKLTSLKISLSYHYFRSIFYACLGLSVYFGAFSDADSTFLNCLHFSLFSSKSISFSLFYLMFFFSFLIYCLSSY
jgi:hypothetical protein